MPASDGTTLPGLDRGEETGGYGLVHGGVGYVVARGGGRYYPIVINFC